MVKISSKLVDKETNHSSHPKGSYKQFLDEQAPAETLASERLYEKVDGIEATEKLWNLKGCRQTAWFVRHEESGEVRIASKKCHLRWCFHCAESRQAFITSQVTPWWSTTKFPKLLTVTLKHTSAPLADQIQLLYRSFSKLRNRSLMKNRCIAGVWFFQITRNHKTNTWHPHLHALIDSGFLKIQELAKQWYEITNGSSQVHIKAVQDKLKTLTHHARYAARPSSLVDLDDAEAMELYDAFKNRRIVGAWGKAKAISFRQVKPVDSELWQNIGTWAYVFAQVGHDMRADRIVFAWGTGGKLEDDNSLYRKENGNEEMEMDDAPEKIPKREIQSTLF